MKTSFPDSSVGKESTCNTGDPSSIPGSGRSTGEEIGYPLQYSWASLVAQLVKNPPAVWKTWIQSLGWKDSWRRERLPTPVLWPGEFHELHSLWGHKELDTSERLSLHSEKIFGTCITGKILIFLRLTKLLWSLRDLINIIDSLSLPKFQTNL